MFKNRIHICLCVLASLVIAMAPVSAQEPVTIQATINYADDSVVLTGASCKANEVITCYVLNPKGYLEFTGNTTTDAACSYTFAFSLVYPMDGYFKAYVKSASMAEPLEYEFQYKYQTFGTTMVGYEFEQGMPQAGGAPVQIHSIQITPLNMLKGIYRLTIDESNYTYTGAGEPFFFWATNQGMFLEYTPDFKSVVFQADAGTGLGNVKVVVGCGDGLGYADRKALLLPGNEM